MKHRDIDCDRHELIVPRLPWITAAELDILRDPNAVGCCQTAIPYALLARWRVTVMAHTPLPFPRTCWRRSSRGLRHNQFFENTLLSMATSVAGVDIVTRW